MRLRRLAGAGMAAAFAVPLAFGGISAAADEPPPDIIAGLNSRTPTHVTGLEGDTPTASASPQERARRYLADHEDVYHARGLGLAAAGTSVAGDTTTVRFIQRHHGVPVLGGTYLVHADTSGVTSAAGSLFTDLTVDSEPAFTEQAAISLLPFVDTTPYTDGTRETEGHGLVILPDGTGTLAYHLTVTGLTPAGRPSRREVYLDAHHGTLALDYDNLQQAGPADGTGVDQQGVTKPLAVYDTDSGYELRDRSKPMWAGRGGEILTYDAAGASVTKYQGTMPSDAKLARSGAAHFDGTNTDSGAVDAHWGAGQVYDFYRSLGRDGIDGKGGSMSSVVDVTYGGRPFDNAFWDGTKMVYGRSSNGRSFAADLDVVGHEMTHGVTDHSGGLIYLQQSGAINEAVSDYFGNAIDVTDSRTPMGDPAAGLLGEDLCPQTSPQECALRDMNDGRRAERDYLSLPPDVDNGGVHLNSTIFSGALWDIREKLDPKTADKIIYTALTQYFTPFTDFYAGRLAVLDAARSLGSSQRELVSISKAFDEHGITKSWQQRLPHDSRTVLSGVQPSGAPDVDGKRWVIGETDPVTGDPQIRVGTLGSTRTRVISEPVTGSRTVNGVIGNTAPRISGDTVVWTRLTRVNPYWVNADVVRGSFDGGTVTDLHPGGGMQGNADVSGDTFVWSGDEPLGGTGDHNDLFVKSGDAPVTNLTPELRVQGYFPRISGDMIAYIHVAGSFNGRNAATYDLSTDRRTILPAGKDPSGNPMAYAVQVDTNGTRVVWSETDFDEDLQLRSADADGGDDRVLVPQGSPDTPFAPQITVNDKWLVYSDYRGYYTSDTATEDMLPNLWIMPIKGGTAEPVSCNPGAQEAPVLGEGRRVLWLDSTFGDTSLVTRDVHRTRC
ncbi:M4 family metallopeptidase [Streptomyces sp. NPDC050507]|uniref:M4 family metallopeptidase n=1 Tax=Streptomyces sp. NPDC050507 TaxID=3365619 RepID=UPI0037B19219